MDPNDLNTLLASDNGYWQAANPIRAGIIRTALREANYGLCDGAALSKYDASGEWCSEFARWVFDNSPRATNSFIHDWLSALDATEDLITLFQDYNCGQPTGPGYTPRQYMTPSTPKPGGIPRTRDQSSASYGVRDFPKQTSSTKVSPT